MEKKGTLSFTPILIGFLLVIVLILAVFSSITIYNLQKENEVFKSILFTDVNSQSIAEHSQRANDLYLEASLSYEDADYKTVESNCRLARGWFSSASQGYLDLQSELDSSGINEEIIVLYSEALGVLSEIQLNMFEACEHFESASRYYDTYYNTEVLVTDPSFELGNAEIEAMNEKIALHDENVRKYNSILADYKVELGRRL